MRFLYVAPRYHTNQMDTMKGLIEHGHEVCFISHYAAMIEDYSYVTPIVLGYSRLYQIIDYLYVHVIHRKKPEAIVFKIQHGFPPLGRLRKIICDFRPDVVILRERSVYSMAAYHICKKKGFPCILYNQNPLWSKAPKTDPAHRLVEKMSPKIRITPVIGTREEGTAIRENDYFVPFVVEPQAAPVERTYFENDTIHILCIGKYETRKHHIMLLQAVEELLEQKEALDGQGKDVCARTLNGFRLQVTLIGEATMHFQKEYCEQVKTFVKEHRMEHMVTVKTNVPRSKMAEEYLAADLYVIPSTREMASVSQLEAMSYSLPVICSDTNGTACYVEDGITGLQFRDCDQENLKRQLGEMLSDRDRMKRMGAAGYRAVASKYNYDTYFGTIQEILKKMREEDSLQKRVGKESGGKRTVHKRE